MNEKMKKKNFFVSICLFVFLLGCLTFVDVLASDDDDDGIEDSIEDLNKRNINIEFRENETRVESILRGGSKIDDIEFVFKQESDGLEIKVSYESEFNSESDKEIEFEVVFHEIVEYVDMDFNAIYDPSIDQTIQNLELDNFSAVVYSNSTISNDTTLHYFKIGTVDGVFIAYIYIGEEFTIVNNTLINPTQIKIDIEINNFNYKNESSQLALYTKLNSEESYEEEEETEDEQEGYATDEEGVITLINQFTGFFTWKKNATIDGISKNISISEILEDDHNATEQKLYINYPRGTIIYHDPKIGIESILLSGGATFPYLLLTILIIVIGSISVSLAYTIVRLKNKENTKSFYDDRDPGLALHILRKENSIEKLSQLRNVNITAFSKDFMERIKKFVWEENEMEEFLEEMASLAPYERNLILDEMEKKSNHNDVKN